MGRIVNFIDTKSKGNSADGFKAPKGKYFSTRQAYEKWEQKRVDRSRCIEALMELLGYDDPNMKPNTFLFRELKSLEPYGYDVIFDTILECEDAIEYTLETKGFNNEINEIKYIMAIINNNIKAVYNRKQAQQKLKERKGQIIQIEDFIPKKQTTNDISRWLDDEDD